MQSRLIAIHNDKTFNLIFPQSTLYHLNLKDTPIVKDTTEIHENDCVLYIMHTTSCRTYEEMDRERFREVQKRAKDVFIILMRIQGYFYPSDKYGHPLENVNCIEVHLNYPAETTKCCQFLKFTSAPNNLAPWVSDESNQQAYEEMHAFLYKQGMSKSRCLIL